MPYNLLLFPLVGGYYILTNFVYLKYKYQRLSSQRLLFSSILVGIVLVIITFLLRAFVELLFPGLYDFVDQILSSIPLKRTPYLGTMFLSLVFAFSGTHFANWLITQRYGRTAPISRALRKHGDELENLFRFSVEEGWLLQLTLKDNKVYIGFITEIPKPKETNYVVLMPIVSGFRNPETKRMTLTTWYDVIRDLLQDRDLADLIAEMKIVIKQDEIITASPHDPEVFEEFEKVNEQLNAVHQS